MDFPIENGDFPLLWDSLPEGNRQEQQSNGNRMAIFRSVIPRVHPHGACMINWNIKLSISRFD